jgi:hypothetical protein
MDAPLIATVRFELFPAEISGKTRGYRSGIRPNHYIHELGCTVIGNVDFKGNGAIGLGETKEAIVTYVFWEPLAKVLKSGLIYEVREGSHIVGKVRVLFVDERA